MMNGEFGGQGGSCFISSSQTWKIVKHPEKQEHIFTLDETRLKHIHSKFSIVFVSTGAVILLKTKAVRI